MILPGEFARQLAGRVLARFAVALLVAGAIGLVGYGAWMSLVSVAAVTTPAATAMAVDSASLAPSLMPSEPASATLPPATATAQPTRTLTLSATAIPTQTPIPATITPESTATIVPTNTSLPTATPDYAALMAAELEEMRKDAAAERARADADAAMWREVWRWACLAGLAPVAVLLTGLVVLVLRKMAQGDDPIAADETDEQEEAPEAERVSLEVKTNGGKSLLWHQYPVDKRVLRQWIRVALNGGSIAIGNWAGSNKPFTRGSYEKFIDYWLTAGVLMDKYPGVENSERVLTEGGAAALQAVLAQEFGYV